MAAPAPSRGGCWPWCTAPSAALTAELAQAATGLATRRGRSEYRPGAHAAGHRSRQMAAWRGTSGHAGDRTGAPMGDRGRPFQGRVLRAVALQGSSGRATWRRGGRTFLADRISLDVKPGNADEDGRAGLCPGRRFSRRVPVIDAVRRQVTGPATNLPSGEAAADRSRCATADTAGHAEPARTGQECHDRPRPGRRCAPNDLIWPVPPDNQLEHASRADRRFAFTLKSRVVTGVVGLGYRRRKMRCLPGGFGRQTEPGGDRREPRRPVAGRNGRAIAQDHPVLRLSWRHRPARPPEPRLGRLSHQISPSSCRARGPPVSAVVP